MLGIWGCRLGFLFLCDSSDVLCVVGSLVTGISRYSLQHKEIPPETPGTVISLI